MDKFHPKDLDILLKFIGIKCMYLVDGMGIILSMNYILILLQVIIGTLKNVELSHHQGIDMPQPLLGAVFIYLVELIQI